MAVNTGDVRGPGQPGASANQYGDRRANDTQIRTALSEAAFDFDDVQPGIGPYVLDDDVLQLTAFSRNSPTLVLNYAILTRDNGVVLGQERAVLSGGTSGTIFSFPLREGFLLAATITPSSQVGSGGYIFASLGLRRLVQAATNNYCILCQGYLSQVAPLTFPNSVMQRPADGMGVIRVISGSVPAAGADISETVPSGLRWQLLALRASLTSAVAVANRQPQLVLDDGANVFYQTPQGPNQAASLVWAYQFAPLGQVNAQSNTQVEIQYDNAQFLEAAFRIRSITAAIQAADQWTAPVYCVREWQGTF